MVESSFPAPARTQARRSLLAGQETQLDTVRDRGLAIRELAFLPQRSVRIDPERIPGSALDGLLPVQPNRWLDRDGVSALWFGPDEWLLLGAGLDDGPTGPLLEDAAAQGAAVVDVSAQRVVLELVGDRVREVLAHGCSLDLHPRVWQPGSVVQTLLARAPVGLVLRATRPDVVWLLVRASFAPYLLAWLVDATTGLQAAPIRAAASSDAAVPASPAVRC